MDFADAFIQEAAKHFREPEIKARKHSEDRRDAHDQVEVRDHEVPVVQIQVQRGLRQEQAGKPAADEQRNEAEGKQHGAVELEFCRPTSVPSQLNVLIADGTPMVIVRIENANAEYGLIPLMNM